MLQSRDLQFLNHVLTAYASSMIEKMAFHGDTPINGNITAIEIKNSTGRERLSAAIISHYENHLRSWGINATYNPTTQSINLHINSVFDLNLGPQDAARAATALNEYRQFREHQ